MCGLVIQLLSRIGVNVAHAEKFAIIVEISSSTEKLRHSFFFGIVCQDNWEQTAVLFVSKSFVQPFKNLRDRPCRVSVSQECQEDADDPCVAQYNGGTRGSEFLRCAARSPEVAASHPINLSHRSGSAGAVLLI